MAERSLSRSREDYALHLSWLLGLMMFRLSGGEDYPVPDPAELFSTRAAPDLRDGESIRQSILQQLQAERSESWRKFSSSPQP